MSLISRVQRKFTSLFHRIYQMLFRRPYGVILMLHRVVKERSLLEDNRKLEVTPAFLEQTILKYKSAGYCFASLNEVQRQIESGKRGKQKFVCFTFDDGYADNFELAYPVFKKHNCPFAIYIATDFPDKKALLWWYDLQDIIRENEKVLFNGVEYDCSDLEKKNQTFRNFRDKVFIPSGADMVQKALVQLNKENVCSVHHDVQTLSWEQISNLAAGTLCTIGAHTVSHPSLPLMSNEKIRKELSDGKKKIEDKIKKPVKHFAYPFGNWDDRVASLVMEQFSTSVLVWGGAIRKGDALDRLSRNELIEKPL